MGTIKTTVKLEANALPFPVNYTTSTSNVVVASNYARVSISDNETATLSNIKFGTEGGIIYAQSPSTNALGTIINIWLVGPDGDRQVASLNPGEAILIPLAPSQQGIYATTNLGKTATLDYHISDKGGKWGQSTLIAFDNNENWEYSVIDVNVNQTPLRIDTGFSTNTWSLWDDWIVQDKGYALEFYNGDVGYVFVDSRGNKVSNSIPSNVSTGANALGGKTFTKLYGTTITLFDGDNVYTHSFDGATGIYVDSNFDDTTSDGSFIIYANDYNGTVYEQYTDTTYLINKGNRFLLTSINYNNLATRYQYANTYVYQYANCIAVRVYNDDTGLDVSYKVFDTTGVLLQDLDVSSYNLMNQDFLFYGDNTFHIISHSNLDGNNYMFNYNHELNRFLGKNFELLIADSYDYYISYYSKSLGFEEPYEPNGIAITVYNDDNYAGWAYLSQYTTDCKIYYLVEGMNTFSVYAPNKPIWFQREMYTTRTNVFLVWGDNDGNAAGPIKMLALNSSLYTNQNIDTNSITLLADFEPVHSANWYVWRYPAGNEYLVHSFSQQDDTNNYVVIAKKGLVRSLTMINAEWYWTTGYNAFSINMGSDNYGSTNFYYDFKQNTFVNLNKWYNIETFPTDYGTYDLGDVKNISSKLFLINQDTKTARILNGSNITSDKALPYSGDNYNWVLGYDFIVWLDFQPTTQSWVIYVYDTSLTLISSFDTGHINFITSQNAGSRIFINFNNLSGDYLLWVSKKGIVALPSDSYHQYIFNDYSWWN